MDKMKANTRQVGGQHYKIGGEEHWDRVARLGLDYFQGQITKYVERWRLKNGVQDLEKARHFLDKYIELNSPAPPRTTEFTVPHKSGDPDLAMKVAYTTPSPEYVETVPMTEINPAGLLLYTFEGHDGYGALYTCKACHVKVRCRATEYPENHHECGAEPGTGYVNQDGPGEGPWWTDPLKGGHHG